MEQEFTPITTQSDNDRKLSPKELRKVRRHSVKARRRRKRIISWFLILVLLAVAAVPAYRHLYQPWRAESVYNTTRNLYGQVGSGKLSKEYNEYFGALYDMNPDVYGWLIVSSDQPENGIDLHLPVVQPQKHDTAFYQTHLFNEESNPYGTPYFMNECQTDQAMYNTVICADQLLFGDLLGYRELDFYKNAPTMFMDTLTDTVIYKIVAVVELSDTEVAELPNNGYETETAFETFITQMGYRSLLYTGVKVNQFDSLLTVVCDNGPTNLAVISRAVRPDEEYTVDTSKAYKKNMGLFDSMTDWVETVTDLETDTDLTVEETVPGSSDQIFETVDPSLPEQEGSSQEFTDENNEDDSANQEDSNPDEEASDEE